MGVATFPERLSDEAAFPGTDRSYQRPFNQRCPPQNKAMRDKRALSKCYRSVCRYIVWMFCFSGCRLVEDGGALRKRRITQ